MKLNTILILFLFVFLIIPSMDAQNIVWQVSTFSGKTFSNISDLKLSGDTLIMKNDSNYIGIITDSITDLKRYSETTFYSCLKTGSYIGCGIGALIGIISALNLPAPSYSKFEDRLFVKVYESAYDALELGSAGALVGGLIGSIYYLITAWNDVYDLSKYNHFKKIEVIRSILIAN